MCMTAELIEAAVAQPKPVRDALFLLDLAETNLASDRVKRRERRADYIKRLAHNVRQLRQKIAARGMCSGGQRQAAEELLRGARKLVHGDDA